jgi:ribose transport system substrate-binding protein
VVIRLNFKGENLKMKKIIKKLLALSLLIVIFAISICSIGIASTKNFTIGIIPKALISPFFITLVDAAKEKGAAEGFDVIVVSPTSETAIAEQVNIIEDFIEKKVDLLALGVNDVRAVVPVLKKAMEAGIPVVIFDTQTPLPDLEVTSLIGSDNVEGGRIVGRYAVKLLNGKGNVAIIEGFPGQDCNVDRLQGFHEIVDKYPEIKVVASQPANWERALGMSVMENILEANPTLDLIFALCDDMALGALKSIEASGRKIPVLSIDGNEEAFLAVRDGRLQSTIAQFPDMMGEMIITKVADALIKGETIPLKLPSPIINVTKENVADFLK